MKDAYYFPHDANARNDPKILAMRSIYGAAGYGWFWIIVEMLREQAEYRLPLDKYTGNALAMQLQCTPDEARKFVEDCINEFHLFSSDGEFFWSDSLRRRMEKYEEKATQARQAALVRWGKEGKKQGEKEVEASAEDSQCGRNAPALRTQCDGNASKVKESKVQVPPPLPPPSEGGATQASATQPESASKTASKEPYTKDFEEFWQHYPRKVEKRRAFKCWQARLREGVQPGDLMKAAMNYAQAVAGKSLEYIKHPSTFLSRDRPYEEWVEPTECMLARAREERAPWDVVPSYMTPYEPPPDPEITDEERRAVEATIAEIRTQIKRRGGTTDAEEAAKPTSDPRRAAG